MRKLLSFRAYRVVINIHPFKDHPHPNKMCPYEAVVTKAFPKPEVHIGDEKRDIDNAPQSWVMEQIPRRRRENDPVCVQVFIRNGPLNMRLITPDCQSGMGIRPPSEREQQIFDLWEKHRMNQPDFSGENLLRFLQEVS
jgi:hypothetical protein